MNFISTRNHALRKSLSEAIQCGLAEDGGLFVPEFFPKIDFHQFSAELSYIDFAKQILQPYFLNDALDQNLSQICEDAFNFPAPLKKINDNTFMLELFHGPTLSFKDFGARFLAGCLSQISKDHKTTVMVATSGDTGSAVASAFYKKPNLNVIILYPDNQVTERQHHQITCWDDNVLALAVKGSFDDCQRLVKEAFQDSWWKKNFHLSSANSINIGRLLPQIIYYAYTSLQFYSQHKLSPGFIVPTGNLGNATAGYYAKMMGFPIREIVLATNANQVILNYLRTGVYHAEKSIATLANAMDVGNPSNFERFQHLFNTYEIFKNNVRAISANDADIRKTILDIYRNDKIIICPHTATAFFARQELSDQPWIVVATADPGKFETVIEPLIQTTVPIAPQLKKLLDRPTQLITVDNHLESVQKIVSK